MAGLETFLASLRPNYRLLELANRGCSVNYTHCEFASIGFDPSDRARNGPDSGFEAADRECDEDDRGWDGIYRAWEFGNRGCNEGDSGCDVSDSGFDAHYWILEFGNMSREGHCKQMEFGIERRKRV